MTDSPPGAPAREMPRVSVLIPVRDGAATMNEQLDALAAQDPGVPWEVVVADNGSADGTRERVLGRARAFPVPLRLLDASAGRGAAHARNAAVRAAHGELLVFCDADDRVGPRWLRAAVEGLAELDVVGGPLRRLTVPFDADAPRVPFDSVSGDGIVTCSVGLRREVFERVGGFDATFAGYGREDYELTVRLWEARARMGTAEDMLCYYRLLDSSWTFVRKIHASAVADVAVWRRHPGRFPGRQGRGFVLRRTVALPLDLLRAGRGGGPRRMARVVVNLAAHARTMLPPQRPLGPPRYLCDTPPAPELTRPG